MEGAVFAASTEPASKTPEPYVSPLAVKKNDGWIKLGRGLGNLTTGMFEVLNQPAQMAKTERWPIALLGGIPKGVGVAFWRTFLGIYETVTFPFPIPAGYRPMMEPEFVIPPS